MKNIPCFSERVLAYKFSKTNGDLIAEIEPLIEKFEKTYKYLQGEKFKDILKYALALGNYLNGTGPRGGAFGFKIDNLEKLNDVKMNDNKTTLLMHLVEIMDKKYGEIVTPEENELMEFFSKYPVSQLGKEIGELR